MAAGALLLATAASVMVGHGPAAEAGIRPAALGLRNAIGVCGALLHLSVHNSESATMLRVEPMQRMEPMHRPEPRWPMAAVASITTTATTDAGTALLDGGLGAPARCEDGCGLGDQVGDAQQVKVASSMGSKARAERSVRDAQRRRRRAHAGDGGGGGGCAADERSGGPDGGETSGPTSHVDGPSNLAAGPPRESVSAAAAAAMARAGDGGGGGGCAADKRSGGPDGGETSGPTSHSEGPSNLAAGPPRESASAAAKDPRKY